MVLAAAGPELHQEQVVPMLAKGTGMPQLAAEWGSTVLMKRVLAAAALAAMSRLEKADRE
jgi:hypothetical protein